VTQLALPTALQGASQLGQRHVGMLITLAISDLRQLEPSEAEAFISNLTVLLAHLRDAPPGRRERDPAGGSGQ
jgi:hypothetical protein